MNENNKITHQTFHDLSTWLITPNDYATEQLDRLQNEDTYLPLISLAHQYWLVGALINQLKGAEVWGKLPNNLKNYLLDIEVLYFNRIDTIKEEAINVIQLLANKNIDIVVMKGAASLFNGVADPISIRYMKDIDLLVREDLQQSAYDILRLNGYDKDKAYFNVNALQAHHAPPLLKNNICYIELHRWVLTRFLKKVLNTDDVWKASEPLYLTQELVVNQLSPTHQVILSIAHSEIQNGGYDQQHIDLHQYYNLFCIVSHFSDDIDWQTVKHSFEKSHQAMVLTATLYIMYRLFKLVTPITVKHSEQAKTHFEKCLTRYVKYQGKNTRFSVVMEQLYGYKRSNIKLMYGKYGFFGYLIGAIQHTYSHCRKLVSIPHIKLYILRIIKGT